MRSRIGTSFATAAACAAIVALSTRASAQDLVVDNTTITLGGTHRYNTVRVVNNGRINVPAFNGTDRQNTGNLVLVAQSITVDATSSIVATGAGYQPVLCGNGSGPNAASGGRGGCAVR